jgi:hypothetical protein
MQVFCPAVQARNGSEVTIRLLTRSSRREETRFSSSGSERVQRFRSPKVAGSCIGGADATDRTIAVR